MCIYSAYCITLSYVVQLQGFYFEGRYFGLVSQLFVLFINKRSIHLNIYTHIMYIYTYFIYICVYIQYIYNYNTYVCFYYNYYSLWSFIKKNYMF